MKIETKDKYIYITNGDLDIVLSCLGASIVEIKYNDDLLTMTPINYDDLNREDIYYGKTIGPVANRVKDGLIKIDNQNYYLPLNEKGVCNHSGKAGLSNQIFDVDIKEEKVIVIGQKDNPSKIEFLEKESSQDFVLFGDSMEELNASKIPNSKIVLVRTGLETFEAETPNNCIVIDSLNEFFKERNLYGI